MGSGRLDEAAVEFQAALDAGHPRPGRCHNGLGLVASQKSQWAESVAQFSSAIGKTPALAYCSRGGNVVGSSLSVLICQWSGLRANHGCF